MPQPPKEKKDKDTWADDQQKHEYYYDDSHGYEDFDPEGDEDESDEDAPSRGGALDIDLN